MVGKYGRGDGMILRDDRVDWEGFFFLGQGERWKVVSTMCGGGLLLFKVKDFGESSLGGGMQSL